MSKTTTAFKAKSCARCNRNHDLEGTLCAFCRDKAEAALSKRRIAPEHYWVECLIEREGDTVLNVGLVKYTFKKNDLGHSICEIVNPGHYAQIIKSSLYVPYNFRTGNEPEVGDKEQDNGQGEGHSPQASTGLFSEEDAIIIQEMLVSGLKVKEIADKLTKVTGNKVPWQRVNTHLKRLEGAGNESQATEG